MIGAVSGGGVGGTAYQDTMSIMRSSAHTPRTQGPVHAHASDHLLRPSVSSKGAPYFGSPGSQMVQLVQLFRLEASVPSTHVHPVVCTAPVWYAPSHTSCADNEAAKATIDVDDRVICMWRQDKQKGGRPQDRAQSHSESE